VEVFLVAVLVFFASGSLAAFAPVLVINATINAGNIPLDPWGGYYYVFPSMGITYSGVLAFTGYYSSNSAFYGTPSQISMIYAQPFNLPCGSVSDYIYSVLFTNFTITYSGSNYNVTYVQYTLDRNEPLTMLDNIEAFECQANEFCLVTGYQGASSWQYTFFLNTLNPPAPPSTSGNYLLQYTQFPYGNYDQQYAYAGGQSTFVKFTSNNLIQVYVPPSTSGSWQNVTLIATNQDQEYTFTCTVQNSYFPSFVFNQKLSLSTKNYQTSMTEYYSTRPPTDNHGHQSSSNVECYYSSNCEINLGSDGWNSYKFRFTVNES